MTAPARKLERADRPDPGELGSAAELDAHAELVADIIVAGLRR